MTTFDIKDKKFDCLTENQKQYIINDKNLQYQTGNPDFKTCPQLKKGIKGLPSDRILQLKQFHNYPKFLRKTLKVLLPSYYIILIAILLIAIFKLNGAIQTYGDCSFTPDGKKGSCIKFSEPGKECKSFNCRSLNISVIIFTIFFLLMKIPAISEKILKNKWATWLVFILGFSIMACTIGFASDYIANKGENTEGMSKEDIEEMKKKKQKSITFPIIVLVITILPLIGGIMGLIFRDKTIEMKGNNSIQCMFSGFFAPLDTFSKGACKRKNDWESPPPIDFLNISQDQYKSPDVLEITNQNKLNQNKLNQNKLNQNV